MTTHSLDACLRLLADRDRRQVIEHLRHEVDGTTTFDDLVDQVYSRGSDPETGTTRDRKDLVIHLKHTHLPKLADRGIVDFESESGSVRYHPDERVETVLDSLPGELSVPNP